MKQKEFKKVISLVLILMSFICLNCLKAKAAVLRQTSGEKVTARGQVVSYFGTSGYQGINTPSEHQNDLTDNWQVMQLADETGAIVANNAAATYALIIKQNPIAVQPYQATGREAKYDQSDIKASVAAWQEHLRTTAASFNDLPFTAYMPTVTLHGTGQSSPFKRNQADQSNYRSVVDPDDGIVQFFVPSLIDVAQGINGLDVGLSTWVSFGVDGFSGSGDLYPHMTWLRSPLYSTYYAAGIAGVGGVFNYDVDSYSFGLRPACWVKIEDQ